MKRDLEKKDTKRYLILNSQVVFNFVQNVSIQKKIIKK